MAFVPLLLCRNNSDRIISCSLLNMSFSSLNSVSSPHPPPPGAVTAVEPRRLEARAARASLGTTRVGRRPPPAVARAPVAGIGRFPDRRPPRRARAKPSSGPRSGTRGTRSGDEAPDTRIRKMGIRRRRDCGLTGALGAATTTIRTSFPGTRLDREEDAGTAAREGRSEGRRVVDTEGGDIWNPSSRLPRPARREIVLSTARTSEPSLPPARVPVRCAAPIDALSNSRAGRACPAPTWLARAGNGKATTASAVRGRGAVGPSRREGPSRAATISRSIGASSHQHRRPSDGARMELARASSVVGRWSSAVSTRVNPPAPSSRSAQRKKCLSLPLLLLLVGTRVDHPKASFPTKFR